jgi:DNA polymerase elongation subunit (family B)
VRQIKVIELKEGMKLARPVTRGEDIVLMAAGTELTPKLIERIIDLGLKEVAVEGAPSPGVPLEEEIRDLEDRFQNVREDPHMSIIYQAVREHLEAGHE